MSHELDPQILAQWIAGTLGPDDQRALDAWLAADPGHAAQLEETRRLWTMAGIAADTTAAATDAAEAARWANVRRAIQANDGPVAATVERPRLARTIDFPTRQPRRGWAWGIAAAVLALVAGGGIWLTGARTESPQLAAASKPARTYETGKGERAEFRLIDGTRIMLNVESRVRVPADFGERNRSVYLEGSAYFEVVHDERRPFAVHAADIVAQDLGTEFVVRAYPEDAHAQVTVREGEVALRAAADSSLETMLHPGQLGLLDTRGRPFVRAADLSVDFAWTGGTLVFDGTPLRETLPQLGRWFDLDFRLSDSSLGTIPVAASLVNQPTDDALQFLAASLGLRAERRGRVVTFLPGPSRR